MKPLRLILPITLFILSGVLAVTFCEFKDDLFVFYIVLYLICTFSLPTAIIWANGGFDN